MERQLVNYEKSVTGFWVPSAYPVEKDKYKDMTVPSEIQKDFNHLTGIIEDKYTREYLKVCAFYNKLFPSLKQYDWSRSSYNAMPFTLQEQERVDTGTGLSTNYLKAAIDLVVSRIGNITFDYKLVAEQPTVAYTIYRDEVERLLKSVIRKFKLNRLSVESFHDAAILAFAHCFIDPWSGSIRKVADWELGLYEAEFSDGHLKRALIRDFAFPVASLAPYIEGWDEDKLHDICEHKTQVDLRLYIDCFRKKKWVAINSDMGPESDYPWDEVLLSSFSWDVGIRKTTVCSLFDTLYPLQRALNKLLAKKTQLLYMYKGPVPVFTGDADLIVKQLSNGAGEALFLDSPRKPTDILTTMNPTPMDPEINSECEALKAQMFELAGVQNMSMDIENYRSAAAVVALDQIRDSGFQSQVAALAQFIRDIVLMYLTYMSQTAEIEKVRGLDWNEIKDLVEDAFLDIKPIHDLDQQGNVKTDEPDIDHMKQHINQFLIWVSKGMATIEDVDYTFDYEILKEEAALRILALRADDVGVSPQLNNLETFLMSCFVKDIEMGQVDLTQDIAIIQEGGEEQAAPSNAVPSEGEMLGG